ncbi:carboxyl-terminal protease [Candidatus Thiomargarita nelsonii]|uniref:Carboxyl-terminal protease n=1 Tax=Candidatus Thiomargarita nelsonii TaxID=1003181 RepID=A0A176S855_9GAMM|nr:carboxyl-terminal protease [Candidatus Thiomargarita nelsonii]
MRYLFLISLFLSNTACIGVKSEDTTPPAEPAIVDIQSASIYSVATPLAQLGYFKGELKQAKLTEVEIALKSFQRDIQVAETGLLNEIIWKRLNNVKLTHAFATELSDLENASEEQQALLKEDESVFAIEKIDCKSPHEAFVLFYKGQLQQVQNDQAQITVTERYALWYDRRHEGVVETDFWCIPRKRFCSSPIQFSDWGGTLKHGEPSYFKKTWTLATRLVDIPSLIANATQQHCHFSDSAPVTPPEITNTHPLPNDWPITAINRFISKNHYLRPSFEQVKTTLNQITDIEALNHYLKSLDPYSKYLPKEQNDFYKQRWRQEQVGLGVNILVNNDHLLAVPIYNGPAYRAGLKSPRYLMTLNDKKIVVTDFSTFSFLTQFSSGARIPLLVSQEDKTKKYTVTVAPFKNPSVEYIKEGKHHLIRIHRFYDGETAQLLKTYLLKTIKQGKDIIIDLRYCPGGSLFEAIDAVSLFLPPDLEIGALKNVSQTQPLISMPGQIVKNKAIYVWTSPFTASAAEFFGQVLQHYNQNAVIVGTTTKGKCLSQQVFEFEEGSALKLTVFEIGDPDKLPCEGIGMTPDVEISPEKILDNSHFLVKTL